MFTVLTGALFEQGGMLDKFTGDGLVAVFGAPLPQPDHALRACRAALAMQAQIEPLRSRWARPDLPPLEVGIGINSGPMIIGNMGSKDRFSYTVIGEEAHLGARLEAANKDFRTRILISEATWRQVADRLAARELDVVTFRGIDRPVGVFELLGERPLAAEQARLAELFAAGLAAFRAGEWAARAEPVRAGPGAHPRRPPERSSTSSAAAPAWRYRAPAASPTAADRSSARVQAVDHGGDQHGPADARQQAGGQAEPSASRAARRMPTAKARPAIIASLTHSRQPARQRARLHPLRADGRRSGRRGYTSTLSLAMDPSSPKTSRSRPAPGRCLAAPVRCRCDLDERARCVSRSTLRRGWQGASPPFG